MTKFHKIPCITESGRPFTLTAEDGKKLVVVTLEGSFPVGAESLAFGIADFSMMYRKGADAVPIQAIAVKYIVWSLHESGVFALTTKIVDRSKATLDIAFELPADVSSFSVRYPRMATGRVTVPK